MIEPNYRAFQKLMEVLNNAWLRGPEDTFDRIPRMSCEISPEMCAALCTAMVLALSDRFKYRDGKPIQGTFEPCIEDKDGKLVLRGEGTEVVVDLTSFRVGPLDCKASESLPKDSLLIAGQLALAWDGEDWRPPVVN